MSILDGLEIPRPRFAFKRAKNIKEHLVRASRNTIPEREQTIISMLGLPKPFGHFKCMNCAACTLTKDTKSIEINGSCVQQKKFSNCNTKNVVYCILCPCGLPYIGQTIQPVKARILQHRSRIRCAVQGAPLVNHFLTKGHNENDLQWSVIFVGNKDPRGGSLQTLLQRKEAIFIDRYKTARNGLNEDDEIWTLISG